MHSRAEISKMDYLEIRRDLEHILEVNEQFRMSERPITYAVALGEARALYDLYIAELQARGHQYVAARYKKQRP